MADANSWGAALTGANRLGQGFDLVAQVQTQWRGNSLAQWQSHGLNMEYSGELGMVFNFDAIINEHIAPRRSILNQKNGFIRY